MDSYHNFHPDVYLRTANKSVWTDFRKTKCFPKNIPDFPETIPAYLNFGYQHIFFLYPRKLSYSSRNAYIKKIRVREPGEASSLLKNLKSALKITSFFVTCTPFS